ncbi:unnamed protein product [Calicophoron daubneyi]|uniref:Ankyrin repeat protein n=1 Tax=Calicophoron daubneyi TaxID=300641 RepID=A0AAV2TEI0_CALDB
MESIPNASELTHFFKAVEAGDLQKVNQIISKYSSTYQHLFWEARKPGASGKSDTAVHIASRGDNVSLLRLAIGSGASLTALNQHNKQPLHEAAQLGRLACVEALLATASVPVDPLKRADWTPLMLTCAAAGTSSASASHSDRFVACAKLLLEHGADPTFTNKDGWNCLHSFIKLMELATYAYAFECFVLQVDSTRDGSLAIVSLLLNHSPQLITTFTSNGRNCLHCVAASGVDGKETHPSDASCCVEHMIIHLAPSLLQMPDACGTLPVFDALRRGHINRASLFLELNPKEQLSHIDKLGQQAVHVASEAGQLGSLKMVVRYLGPKVIEAVTSEATGRQTPLHLACRSGQIQIVQYITEILQENSTVENVQRFLPLDSRGRSPLWYAAVGLPGRGNVSTDRKIACMKALCSVFTQTFPRMKTRHCPELLLSQLDLIIRSVSNADIIAFANEQISNFLS